MIPVGLGSLFLGRSYIDLTTIALNSVCLTFSIIFVLYFLFLGEIFSYILHWIMFPVIMILSLAISIRCSVKRLPLAVAITCFFHGAIIGLLVCTASQLKLVYVTYVVVILFGIVSGYVSYQSPDNFMISATSLVGAYMTVRSVALIVTWFTDFEDQIYPNEFVMPM